MCDPRLNEETLFMEQALAIEMVGKSCKLLEKGERETKSAWYLPTA
jgi:hypothetical protein